MMQALLADRFKLKFHREQKEMRRYAMVVLPTGSKNLKPSEPGGEPYRQNSARGTVVRSTTMQEWADFLAGPLETPVVDKTGLPFSSVQAALKQGEQQGLVEQAESGFWRPKQVDPVQATLEANGKVN